MAKREVGLASALLGLGPIFIDGRLVNPGGAWASHLPRIDDFDSEPKPLPGSAGQPPQGFKGGSKRARRRRVGKAKAAMRAEGGNG